MVCDARIIRNNRFHFFELHFQNSFLVKHFVLYPFSVTLPYKKGAYQEYIIKRLFIFGATLAATQ